MANNTTLENRIAAMRQSFFDDGILDEFFVQAEQLGNDDPSFLRELFTTYFRQSTRDISAIQNSLESTPCNYNEVENAIFRLKGASSSVGAIKVCQELDYAIQSCRRSDVDSTKAAIERAKNERTILCSKLEPYFQMLRQTGPSSNGVARSWFCCGGSES